MIASHLSNKANNRPRLKFDHGSTVSCLSFVYIFQGLSMSDTNDRDDHLSSPASSGSPSSSIVPSYIFVNNVGIIDNAQQDRRAIRSHSQRSRLTSQADDEQRRRLKQNAARKVQSPLTLTSKAVLTGKGSNVHEQRCLCACIRVNGAEIAILLTCSRLHRTSRLFPVVAWTMVDAATANRRTQ